MFARARTGRFHVMMTNQRLEPLLEQYDWATERLLTRLAGPTSNSGDGSDVAVPVLTDAEYLWEPVDACWSVRRRVDGPGPGAIKLIGSGDWGRDGAPQSPWPPPLTTIAWRLDHISETLLGRSSHLGGDRAYRRVRLRPDRAEQLPVRQRRRGDVSDDRVVAEPGDPAPRSRDFAAPRPLRAPGSVTPSAHPGQLGA
jgi:hypothetical protein